MTRRAAVLYSFLQCTQPMHKRSRIVWAAAGTAALVRTSRVHVAAQHLTLSSVMLALARRRLAR